MGQVRIGTGVNFLDEFLEGGYEIDVITTIYGPGGSGKTNFCLLSAIETVRNGKKVVYIDTEGGFSVSRLSQIAEDYKKILENILFLRPISFKEQKKAFKKLKELIDTTQNIGLILVDTIGMLYRLELGKNDGVYEINRELGKQIADLTEVARKKNIPVLITNQVYSKMDSSDNAAMVGGDILKYGSKCLIELKVMKSGIRAAILRKHRSIKDEKNILFRIIEKGVEKIEKIN